MTAQLQIGWRPLVSVDPRWELEFHRVLTAFNVDVEMVASAPQGASADAYVLAYPATAHKEIRTGTRLSDMCVTLPEVALKRVALFACDQAWPRVSEREVTLLLQRQADSLEAPRHAFRVMDLTQLNAKLSEVVRLTMYEKGLLSAAEPFGLSVPGHGPEGGDSEWMSRQ